MTGPREAHGSAKIAAVAAFLSMTSWCVAQPVATPPNPSANTAARASYALLIAVSDYGISNLRSLQGPENDVRLVQEVLTSRFRVPLQNITVLINKQATHTGIERAFAELAKRVQKGDFVYIHYSGHGSTAPDPREARGQDQTWVSYGARSKRLAGNDDLDILDKEIAVWLKPLYDRTDEVVFVSDSCHSATVARGEPLGTRAVDADPRPHALLSKLPRLPAPTTGLRIGAARDVESAVEVDTDKGGLCTNKERCNGIFTWYWIQALQQAQPGERWADVFNRTFTLVTNQSGVSQRPQMEGISGRPVLGGDFPRLPATVSITNVNQDGSVRLGAGATSRVTNKSTYRRFDPNDPTAASLPMLEVIKVEPFWSEARVTRGQFSVGDAVAEVGHVYSFEPIRLYVGGDLATSIDANLVQEIRNALQDLAGFALVDDRTRADWWVYVVRSARAGADNPKSSNQRLPGKEFPTDPTQPPVVWVVSPQGVLAHDRMRIAFSDHAAGIKTLIGNLEKFAWSREVKGLAARGNTLPVNLVVRVHSQDLNSPGAGPYLFTQVEAKPRFNDWLSFRLENKDSHNQSWYAYVFAVTPGAAVKRIHPQNVDNEDEARLTQGQLVEVRSAYHLNESGIETILLVVTEKPIDPQILEQPGFEKKGGKPKSQLEARLSGAARRKGDVETSPDLWGIASAEFAITGP